jgi:hypothetical protein
MNQKHLRGRLQPPRLAELIAAGRADNRPVVHSRDGPMCAMHSRLEFAGRRSRPSVKIAKRPIVFDGQHQH